MRFIAWKEALHILRDRRALILVLVMPAFLTVLFGYALEGGDIQDIPTAWLNLDGSPESNIILSDFRSYPDLNLRDGVKSLDEATKLLHDGKVKVVVVVPAGFAARIKAGQGAQVQLLLDGTDQRSAPVAEGVAKRVIAAFNARKAAEGLWAKGIRPDRRLGYRPFLAPVELKADVLYNPDLRFSDYAMPGVIGLTLQLISVMLMAMTVTRERERGTIDQLMVTPLRRGELFLGKLIPYFVISMIHVATVLFIAWNWFGVPLGNRPVALALLCVLFILSSLATGLLISTVSRSQFQAVQITIFYILPVFILSGAYTPLETIPEYIRPIAYIFPLTYFSRALRAVSLRGVGISVVWQDLTILWAFAVVMLYWSVISFHKRVA